MEDTYTEEEVFKDAKEELKEKEREEKEAKKEKEFQQKELRQQYEREMRGDSEGRNTKRKKPKATKKLTTKEKRNMEIAKARNAVRAVGTAGGFLGSGYKKGSTIITKGKYPANESLTPREQSPYLSKGGQFDEQQASGRTGLAKMIFEGGATNNNMDNQETLSKEKRYDNPTGGGLLSMPISEKKEEHTLGSSFETKKRKWDRII